MPPMTQTEELKNSGLKATLPRIKILDVFQRTDQRHMTAEDVFASGDRTVARVTASGTQTGEWMGIPPSGRRAEVRLIDIMRFDDAGLIREHWGVMDMLSMLQQLGVIPEAASTP